VSVRGRSSLKKTGIFALCRLTRADLLA